MMLLAEQIYHHETSRTMDTLLVACPYDHHLTYPSMVTRELSRNKGANYYVTAH